MSISKCYNMHLLLADKKGEIILAIEEDGTIHFRGKIIQGPDDDTSKACYDLRKQLNPRIITC